MVLQIGSVFLLVAFMFMQPLFGNANVFNIYVWSYKQPDGTSIYFFDFAKLNCNYQSYNLPYLCKAPIRWGAWMLCFFIILLFGLIL